MCVFERSVMQDTGQNIVSKYDYNTGTSGNGGVTDHFTQVVCKGTTEIGCGATICNDGAFSVCNYSPPGNFRGEFLANVFKP
ncbi:hypothetical protein INT48_005934 [Thamnidium elegans]|uniref:SCP domain-containing protein n=1 Tax=Thamnidium elegans TaxID=101142 RepID=A0A8H7VPM1_9FUNG|nr:hypothetical protein INT48_005934 [Thamnidium elegans]